VGAGVEFYHIMHKILEKLDLKRNPHRFAARRTQGTYFGKGAH
jgi:hypothetical protein